MKKEAFGKYVRKVMKEDFHLDFNEFFRDVPEKDVYMLLELFMLREELEANTVPKWMFNSLLETIPYLLFIVGVEKQIVECNLKTFERFGYKRKDLVGLPFEKLLLEKQWNRLEGAGDRKLLLGFKTQKQEIVLGQTTAHYFPSPEGHPKEMLIIAKEVSGPQVSALKQLTEAEFEILKLLMEGMEDKEIAEALKCSPRTVATHLESIRKKLNARNSKQLIAIAYKAGLGD
jgi:DNA-binding CsgD family transcriptional regulator